MRVFVEFSYFEYMTHPSFLSELEEGEVIPLVRLYVVERSRAPRCVAKCRGKKLLYTFRLDEFKDYVVFEKVKELVEKCGRKVNEHSPLTPNISWRIQNVKHVVYEVSRETLEKIEKVIAFRKVIDEVVSTYNRAIIFRGDSERMREVAKHYAKLVEKMINRVLGSC